MPAEIPDGAVLVARGILNSSLWTMRPADRVVALTCIAICNHRPAKWFDGSKEILIKRGQFVRSWEELRKACGLPLQVVRTSVQHLENTDFLTRFSTRVYTLFTIPKYEHYQDLTKYSDSAVVEPNTVSNTRLTRDQHAANNKQQPQPPRSSPVRRSSGKTGPRRNGSVVVVQRATTKSPMLKRICVNVGVELLCGVGLSASLSRAFASEKTVLQILSVVQQARLQKKPGGWARAALENSWSVPPADGAEVDEIMKKVSSESEKVRSLLPQKREVKSNLPSRLPGEDDRTWLRRVSDELRARKQAAKPNG